MTHPKGWHAKLSRINWDQQRRGWHDAACSLSQHPLSELYKTVYSLFWVDLFGMPLVTLRIAFLLQADVVSHANLLLGIYIQYK